ncbi:uncharacterized protein LOC133871533 [Alnus glutinosa]|uniref:uncharacterized protein LOC133871533 n=1 Tax=Alnus glutinosa TaxID=3517 RepID=UPI002D781152|nr:uncharacterized protein LOC133871533 [Alnus glutinosa]
MDRSNLPFIPAYEDRDDEIDDEIFFLLSAIDSSDDDENTKMPQRNLPLRGAMYITYMLNSHPVPCFHMFCMEPPDFIALCFELKERQFIKSTRNLHVEESVAIFLLLTGHSQGQRIAANRFQHSTKTINRHYNKVLRALGHLAKVYIKVRHRTGVHPHVQGNPKYPWFKDCIGAVDETHIKAEHQRLFRGRKNECTHNIMEGTANDGRIFKDAVTTDQGFEWPTDGHYYVADSAYSCMRGFLPPYKGERYHLSHFCNRPLPRGYKELFNFRHSSLRMMIENCFSRLKRRWRILYDMPKYFLTRQPGIIMACCTLHNFIRTRNPNDQIFNGTDAVEPGMSEQPYAYGNNDEAGPSHSGQYDFSSAASDEMRNLREGIAHAMWDNAHGNEDGDN